MKYLKSLLAITLFPFAVIAKPEIIKFGSFNYYLITPKEEEHHLPITYQISKTFRTNNCSLMGLHGDFEEIVFDKTPAVLANLEVITQYSSCTLPKEKEVTLKTRARTVPAQESGAYLYILVPIDMKLEVLD
jgi:hypothetical protein